MRRRLVITMLAMLGLAACSTPTDPTLRDNPEPTSGVTDAAGQFPGSRVTVTAPPPAAGPSRGPSGNPPHLLDGTWLVGEDIPAGVWRTMLDEDVFECAWTVTDTTGTVVDDGQATGVDIALRLQPGDLVTSRGCVVWNFLGADYDPDGGSAVSSLMKNAGDPVPPGTYIVGRDIRAGSYELLSTDPGRCDLSVQYDSQLGIYPVVKVRSDDFTARLVPELFIDLDKGAIFESDGCGTWQRRVLG